MDHLKLTHDKLSVEEICQLVTSEKCGAVSMFVGMTRDNFEGKEVKNLEYEAYESMALKVMKNICATIRGKWEQVHHIAIYHRLGTVPVCESSVVIAVSSPHRVDSIAAVQYCIENLKVLKLFDDKLDMSETKLNYLTNPQSIQINASHDEIRERIRKYTDRKREQINVNNIKDFVNRTLTGDESSKPSCARVDAVLVKSKDSKTHLQVKYVENAWGPQTKPSSSSLPKEDDQGGSTGVEERIADIEKRFNVAKPLSADIYARLKTIEDRLSQLEAMSPEYATFWSKKSADYDDSDSDAPARKRSKYSSNEIWSRLKELEKC